MTESTRLLITEPAVERLSYAVGKPRIVRDTKIAGFHLWVGKKTKSYRFQYELPRENGKRGRTQIELLGEHPHAKADDIRARVLELAARRARGEEVRQAVEIAPEVKPLSFSQAWDLYKAAISKETAHYTAMSSGSH